MVTSTTAGKKKELYNRCNDFTGDEALTVYTNMTKHLTCLPLYRLSCSVNQVTVHNYKHGFSTLHISNHKDYQAQVMLNTCMKLFSLSK